MGAVALSQSLRQRKQYFVSFFSQPPETGGKNAISEASDRLASKSAPISPLIATLSPDSSIVVKLLLA